MKKKQYLCTEIYIAMDKKNKNLITRAIVAALLAGLGIIAAGLGLQSCNVKRVITNESSYLQRGDTSVVINTKTTETYDASKKNSL